MSPDQKAIMGTLEAYAATYCAKDVDGLMDLFAKGDAVSLIGTGADELCSGREAVSAVFTRNFRDANATAFVWDWVDIVVAGDAAVVAATLDIHLEIGGASLVVPVRWTVSLARVDGEWKWLHRHASSAAGSQDEGKAYPVGDE